MQERPQEDSDEEALPAPSDKLEGRVEDEVARCKLEREAMANEFC